MGISKKLFAMLLGLGLMGLTIGASANTVSATVSPSLISAPTDWQGESFTVSKFDTTLGVLDQVDFILNGQLAGTINLTNNGPTTSSYEIGLEIDFLATLPTDLVPLVVTSDQTYSGSLPSQGALFIPDVTGSNSASRTLTTNLSAYVGNVGDTFSVPVDATGLTNYKGSSNITYEATSIGTADLQVTYTYHVTSVPTPASVWAGSVLLAGLVYRRIRKFA